MNSEFLIRSYGAAHDVASSSKFFFVNYYCIFYYCKLEQPSVHSRQIFRSENKQEKIKSSVTGASILSFTQERVNCVFYQLITWNKRASSQQFTAELNILANSFLLRKLNLNARSRKMSIKLVSF